MSNPYGYPTPPGPFVYPTAPWPGLTPPFIGDPGTDINKANSQFGYMLNPICLGDGTNKIMFTGVLGEPSIIPEFTSQTNITTYYMRQGAGQPGNRVFRARGGSVGYRDIEFTSIVTSTQLSQLVTWFEQDPTGSGNALFYSPDNGSTAPANIFACLFQKAGFIPQNLKYNHRIFTGVSIKLHILGTGTSIGTSVIS